MTCMDALMPRRLGAVRGENRNRKSEIGRWLAPNLGY